MHSSLDAKVLEKEVNQITVACRQATHKYHPDKFAHDGFKPVVKDVWHMLEGARDLLLADYGLRIAVSKAGVVAQRAVQLSFHEGYGGFDTHQIAQAYILDTHFKDASSTWRREYTNFVCRLEEVGTNDIQIKHFLQFIPPHGWYPTVEQYDLLRDHHWEGVYDMDVDDC